MVQAEKVSASACTDSELIQYIDDFDKERAEAGQASEMFANCGDASVELLINALDQDKRESVRLYSAFLLGELTQGKPDAVDVLIKALTDESFAVQESAGASLSIIGEPAKKVIPTLTLIQLLEHRDLRTRINSINLIGNLAVDEKTFVPLLIKKLNDPSVKLQIITAYALGNYGLKAKQSIPNLIVLLKKSNDPDLRTAIGQTMEKFADLLFKQGREINTKASLEEALNDLSMIEEALLKNSEFTDITKSIEINKESLRQALLIKRVSSFQQYRQKILVFCIIHPLFWVLLIFAYPNSKKVQAIFFWNPWMRTILGMGYVTFALQWTPFLRRKLFDPFRIPLLADAQLDDFNSDLYFADCDVLLPNNGQLQSLISTFPDIQGSTILEGKSGSGKTMFLRYLLKQSQKITVYLPATCCGEGVIAAIQQKLQGDEIKDPKFLQSLIYSGAINICIDGLNEVSADTRQKITYFVESNFKGNIFITTQPMEWTPPATAKTYFLQPLQAKQIEHYLISRQPLLKQNIPNYSEKCRLFLEGILGDQVSVEERNAAQLILSNPMELTLAAWAIAAGKEPDIFHLRQQQYEMMAADYQNCWNQEFPLLSFSEAIYKLWCGDNRVLPAKDFPKELATMENSSFRMVISRQWQNMAGENQKEWYFRHDKIAEFFIAQTFLGDSQSVKARLLEHISDPRFRGVYFLLAILMPPASARNLREELVNYAAKTKDHNVSDEFVLLFDARQ